MKRYIQFYDDHGLEVLGSDGCWRFDQRWSNTTALTKAAQHAWRMLPVRKLCYAKIYNGAIGRGHCIQETVMLIDPTDARDFVAKCAKQMATL